MNISWNNKSYCILLGSTDDTLCLVWFLNAKPSNTYCLAFSIHCIHGRLLSCFPLSVLTLLCEWNDSRFVGLEQNWFIKCIYHDSVVLENSVVDIEYDWSTMGGGKQGGAACCAPNCTNTYGKGSRLFVFPKDPERRKRWIINTRLDQ